MKRYWWVNHNKTFLQEVSGGYLWSPKTEAKGVRSRFYDNMRRASPGDLVLSFAKKRIGFVGEVIDFAVTASKPGEFGTVGANWAAEGWLLPIAWRRLRRPAVPKEFIDRLAPLLPEKYSPIRAPRGIGNQKAYLAEVDRAVFEEVLNHAEAETPIEGSAGSKAESFDLLLEYLDTAAEARIRLDETLSATEKAQLIKARRGQGDFRRDLERFEHECRITGLQNPRLLRASHIKPWRLCVSSRERLDGCNGLLLAPHVDLLFDRGLITFSEGGRVVVSPRLDIGDVSKLRLSDMPDRSVGSFLPQQRHYLAYHRNEIFLSGTS
jgi:putative restriction endonuclease